jgi:outer membrane protein W
MNGLWLGGWATDVFGARIMYRASALLVMVGMAAFAAVTRFHAPPAKIQPHAILSQMSNGNEDDLELMRIANGVAIPAPRAGIACYYVARPHRLKPYFGAGVRKTYDNNYSRIYNMTRYYLSDHFLKSNLLVFRS